MTADNRIDALRQMAAGFSGTQILYTAASLGIADALAAGPRSADDLAPELGTDATALRRFLRMMVALRLLAQDDPDSFALAPLGEFLRSNHPESLRDRILYIGEISYPTARGMLHALKTGSPAFDHVFGMPFFEYIGGHPLASTLFNKLMSDELRDRADAIIGTYDFSHATTVADIGGGNGALLTAILRKNPRARGIVFDRPGVIAAARRPREGADVSERLAFVEGDVFGDELPRGADLYLLSRIIHDWDDARATAILENCARASVATSRILIIEELLPERVLDAPATAASDFGMMLLTGGTERSEREYRALAEVAGLRLASVIPFSPARVYNGRKPSWAILECTAETVNRGGRG